MGGMLINMFSDIDNAELIVVWGANPATDCHPVGSQSNFGDNQTGCEGRYDRSVTSPAKEFR
jgi:anaerobic selenocysteine-containing dehydrogenase